MQKKAVMKQITNDAQISFQSITNNQSKQMERNNRMNYEYIFKNIILTFNK